MSLSRGRRRVQINGAVLSRAQTITFIRKQEAGECIKQPNGITVCKTNQDIRTLPQKLLFRKRPTHIEPKLFKPTKEDIIKGVQEIDPKCGLNKKGEKICENDKGQKVNVKSGKVESTKFFQSVIAQIKEIGDDPVKATFKLKDKTIEFILTNENKFRAAKAIADAISLGLITVGGIAISTGIGAGAGAIAVAGGTALGAGSKAFGKGLDLSIKTAKKIQQLENAIEVARQVLSGKKDEAEPRVGRSLIETQLDKKIKDVAKEQKEKQERLEELRAELQAINRSGEEEDEEKASEEPKDDDDDDIPKGGKPSGGKPSGGRPIVSTLGLVLDEPDVDLDEPDIDLSVLTTEELEAEAKKSKSKSKSLKEQSAELEALLDEPSPSPTPSPRIQVVEITPPQFQFTEISNADLINGASRRKLEDAMKTDLLDRPKNFSNPNKLTDEQIRGAVGNGKLDKGKAAIINNNSENIYNKITREIAQAETNDECMEYIRANAAKIAILPPNLKDELREFCESILDDDE